MNNSTAVFGLLFAAVLAYLKYLATGNDWTGFFFILIFLSSCISFVWFLSRGHSKAPSTIESGVAFAWLWFRRAVSFSGAALFIVGAVWIPIYGNPLRAGQNLAPLDKILIVFFLLAMAAFCLWVGVFGQGSNSHDWHDDVALHRENKRRYHWRW